MVGRTGAVWAAGEALEGTVRPLYINCPRSTFFPGVMTLPYNSRGRGLVVRTQADAINPYYSKDPGTSIASEVFKHFRIKFSFMPFKPPVPTIPLSFYGALPGLWPQNIDRAPAQFIGPLNSRVGWG